MSSIQAIIYVGVGYLGNKPFKTDTIYGTNLSWSPGSVQQVPSSIANQMCYRHPDVYAMENSPIWQRFVNGEPEPSNLLPVAEFDLDTFVKERHDALLLELKNCPRKDMVESHALVTQLNVTWPKDAVRSMIEIAIAEAYRDYLTNDPERAKAVWQALQGAV